MNRSPIPAALLQVVALTLSLSAPCAMAEEVTQGPLRSVAVNGVQGPALINAGALARATSENVRIVISLEAQRAYVFAGDELAIDTPISTGTASHRTPSGEFTILQKKEFHRSSLYGNFVNSKGRIVKSGVSSRSSKRPSGSHFVGTPVPFWQRLTEGGVGMHAGTLPGYPASHGCLRFPAEVIPLIYQVTKIGTPVRIQSGSSSVRLEEKPKEGGE